MPPRKKSGSGASGKAAPAAKRQRRGSKDKGDPPPPPPSEEPLANIEKSMMGDGPSLTPDMTARMSFANIFQDIAPQDTAKLAQLFAGSQGGAAADDDDSNIPVLQLGARRYSMADLNVFAGLADALTGLRGSISGPSGSQAEAASNALNTQSFGSFGSASAMPDMNAIIAAANAAASANQPNAADMPRQGRRKSLRRPAPINGLSSLGQQQQNAGAGAFMPTPTTGSPFVGGRGTPMVGMQGNAQLQMALGQIIQQGNAGQTPTFGTPVTPGSAVFGGMGGQPMQRPVSEGDRKVQRLEKNRQAAKECRRKKKEYVKCLEERVKLLQEQNTQLLTDLAEVAKSPGSLAKVLSKYENQQQLPPTPQSANPMGGQPTSAITAQLIGGGGGAQ